jgi:hypothetical protein
MISDIYSRPRVTQVAKPLPGSNVLPGFALDLATTDADGRPWNFCEAEMRERARRKLDIEQPMFLVGSPPCTWFTAWQALNRSKQYWPKEEIERRDVEARVHLAFVCELYQAQMDHGRYFLHEHPDTATSWGVECIQSLREQAGVERVVGHQCQYGQQTSDGDPMRKATGWLSNSPAFL